MDGDGNFTGVPYNVGVSMAGCRYVGSIANVGPKYTGENIAGLNKEGVIMLGVKAGVKI